MPSSLGSQDSTLAQNQVQQAGVGSQPGQSQDTVTMPMENDCVHAADSSLPLQGHSGTATDSGIGGGTQRNPDPSNHTEVKGLSTSKASVDKDLPQEGHCGPAPSACKGPAKVMDAVQSAPLSESKGQKSEHKEEGPVTAELAASEVSRWVWWHGSGGCPAPWTGQAGLPSELLTLWLVLTEATESVFILSL